MWVPRSIEPTMWDFIVCWFHYPSGIDHYINNFAGGEMAGGPTTEPSVSPSPTSTSTHVSATSTASMVSTGHKNVQDRTCNPWLWCIEKEIIPNIPLQSQSKMMILIRSHWDRIPSKRRDAELECECITYIFFQLVFILHTHGLFLPPIAAKSSKLRN